MDKIPELYKFIIEYADLSNKDYHIRVHFDTFLIIIEIDAIYIYTPYQVISIFLYLDQVSVITKGRHLDNIINNDAKTTKYVLSTTYNMMQDVFYLGPATQWHRDCFNYLDRLLQLKHPSIFTS